MEDNLKLIDRVSSPRQNISVHILKLQLKC